METKEKIQELERTALDNWAKGDVPGYLVHATSDIIYFDDIGAQEGISGLENALGYAKNISAMIPEHQYEMVDSIVQDLGTTAVHSFKYHPSSLQGEPQTPWRATNVYTQRNGEWKLINSHWSMNKAANP